MIFYSEWPSFDDSRWTTLKRMVEYGVGNKLETSNLNQMGEETRRILLKSTIKYIY
jgi:hypothetical protein